MQRLYAGFPHEDEHFSVSMTINGPAPIMLAMYVAAARDPSKLRGTVQADILKEVQAQNEIIFPIDASLRFLTDMVEWTTAHMPRWYPISISGYHIAEAGATPVQQAALHAVQRLHLRRSCSGTRHGRERLRPAAVVLPRLRPRHRIPRARPRLPEALGHRHARCLRRRRARADPQAAHADQRPVAHRRRVHRTTSRARPSS